MKIKYLMPLLSLMIILFSLPAFAKEPSALLFCSGSLDDNGFNDSGNRGLSGLKAEGWNVSLIELSRDQSAWENTYNEFAQSGHWALLISLGSEAAEAVGKVSQKFPELSFIVYDYTLEGQVNPNIYAVSYKQNEAAYLAGILAALTAGPGRPIGFVGGLEHPAITDFLVGYIQGAKSVKPDIKIIIDHTGDWDDQSKGEELAGRMFQQGASVLFTAAGQAGLGCVEAAKKAGRSIIGVDSDQAMLFKGRDEAAANSILTSVIKNIDQAIMADGQRYLDGQLPLGNVAVLGLAEGGVSLADNEYYQKNVPQAVRDQVEAARQKIVAGQVSVTSAFDLSKDEVGEMINSVKP